MGKAIGRFDPTPSRTPEECERHYTQVHVRMAQELLRPMPALLSYHTNRVVAQADVTGGWGQRPRAWRFNMLRFAAGAALAFTGEQNEMVARDHVNCLFRLRHCDVEETVAFDRLAGQTALAKFLLEADRPPSAGAEAAWASFAALAERVLATMDGAFGARALYVNRVLSELECAPVDVEGQRPVGVLAETTRVGYLEAYFDHARWGEEALGALARDGALGRLPDLVAVNLFRVEEEAPLDTRGTAPPLAATANH